jgi:hypothetical protein
MAGDNLWVQVRNPALLVGFLLSQLNVHGQTAAATQKQPASLRSIRFQDFSQLVGSYTSGIAVSYNADKSTINGSFGIKQDTNHSLKHIWLQVIPSIGTSTNLFTLGQQTPQPDFSLAVNGIFLIENVYGYDAYFTSNYEDIKGNRSLKNDVLSGRYYRYSDSLRASLRSRNPKYQKDDKLIVLKSITWISIHPEWGGTNFTFYDSTRSFAAQIYKPYFHQLGLTVSFNHYYYQNTEDIKWRSPYRYYNFPFFFYFLAVRVGTNNNSDFLKKITLNDITSTRTNAGNSTTRQLVKSTSAYQGLYQDYVAVTPSFEILASVARFFAFDVFGNYNYVLSQKADVKNYGALAGGIYFYTNTSGSKIDIGLYYQHSLSSHPSKEIIGLKTKVPIHW